MGAVEVVADKGTKALHAPEAGVTQKLSEVLLDRGLYTRVAIGPTLASILDVNLSPSADRPLDVLAR